MNPERNKFLTEAMGECWHDWGCNFAYHKCEKCGKYLPVGMEHYREIELIHTDFSTWEGFGKLWEWAIKQEWLDDLLLKSEWFKLDKHSSFILIHTHWLNPDRFADALYKFLKENKGV